jgi:hypothetical protein
VRLGGSYGEAEGCAHGYAVFGTGCACPDSVETYDNL